MLKDEGNSPKKINVNILFVENLINIGARATKLSRKPSYCTTLFVNGVFD